MARRFVLPAALAALVAVSALCAACSSTRGGAAAAPRAVMPAPAAARAVQPEVQRRFNTFFLESVRLRLKGDMSSAYELMEHALHLNPDAAEALYEMAAYEQLLHPDSAGRAESLLRRAVALVPDNYDYRQALADYYYERKQLDSCCAVTEEMVRLFPQRTDLLYNLASLYEDAHNAEALVRTLRRLEQAEGPSEQISRSLAAAYMAQGHADSAVAQMQRLVARTGGEARYRVELADLLAQSGRDDEARQIYDSVLAADPDNTYARLSLLNYYQKQGNDSLFAGMAEALALDEHAEPAARAAVLRALIARSQDGGNADTLRVARLLRRVAAAPQADVLLLRLYASYCVAHGVPTDTVRPLMLRVLRLEPADTELRNALLTDFVQADSMAQVAELCSEGIHYAPDMMAYYYYGAIAHAQLQQNDSAISLLERGTRRLPAGTAPALCSDLYALLGDLYHESGRTAAAYAAYDSALSYKPDNLMCLNNYAYFLSLSRRQLDKAERMSRVTVQAEPRNATYLDTYAWILFEQGRLAEAKIYIDETLKNADSTENSAPLYEHAGDIYVRLGHTAAALDFWRKAQQEGGDSALLRRKIKLKKYIAP